MSYLSNTKVPSTFLVPAYKHMLCTTLNLSEPARPEPVTSGQGECQRMGLLKPSTQNLAAWDPIRPSIWKPRFWRGLFQSIPFSPPKSRILWNRPLQNRPKPAPWTDPLKPTKKEPVKFPHNQGHTNRGCWGYLAYTKIYHIYFPHFKRWSWEINGHYRDLSTMLGNFDLSKQNPPNLSSWGLLNRSR